jgi:hypothetical protein
MGGSSSRHGREQRDKCFIKINYGKTNLENPYTNVLYGQVARILDFHTEGLDSIPNIFFKLK